MKKNKDKKKTEKSLTPEELEFIELLKQQMFGAIIGIYAEVLFYKASYEEIIEISNKAKDIKDEFIDADKTFLESAKLFLISQLIFTKAAFQFYYIVEARNRRNNINESLSPEIKINISCVLNSLGNIYFLDAMEEIIAKKDSEPVVGN